jgi:hypothetical protein
MIDAQLADFLHEGLGIHIGTRNDRLEPNGARVSAVKVEDDGVHFVVYVPKVAVARVLPDLEANGLAAVTFARPIDDRACQLKGTFVGARAANAQERSYVMAQRERFLDQLEAIGIPRFATLNWIVWPAIAIRLKATALFDQTPGPQAGTPIA